MQTYLYFSLVPEALIASQLPPEKFGQYYATGYGYKSKGQALFFDVDPVRLGDFFDLEAAFERCVAHPDGRPKSSVYVSTYRVLEHVPVDALGSLHLTTAYGATLELGRSADLPPAGDGLHLYKELAPVTSLVVSDQDPRTFYEGITVQPSKFVRFPGLAFVELELGELASDPARGHVADLPYPNLHHLREALLEVSQPDKSTKMVERVPSGEFTYRTVKDGSGFYFGNGTDLAFYPMPSHHDLRQDHPLWWRSANQ
ncbi:hypothetical protein [Georgenia muralis]|uniref:Uncharacterized protein n=1 Tax=Georgenia muralis TaxID=154117 RepID=A0A3N4Z9D0_9MICO|nr:hypothetical protein [Georgenia muralis]RPF28743.1 hypothetical protein EDD32_3286 [Georgenia muralis]